MKKIIIVISLILSCTSLETKRIDSSISLYNHLLLCINSCTDDKVSLDERDFSFLVLSNQTVCICKDGRDPNIVFKKFVDKEILEEDKKIQEEK